MSTELQIQANRENAKSSSGPKSEAGKAVAALNNTRHGLAGAFRVLPTESQSDFDELLAVLREEHNPATFTETTLVEAMAQHHWLRRRALSLESSCYDPATGAIHDEKQLALYLRYQTTHERGFHKAMNDLLKLRAAKCKDQIGFERLLQNSEQMNLTVGGAICGAPLEGRAGDFRSPMLGEWHGARVGGLAGPRRNLASTSKPDVLEFALAAV
jgi:hypothetical protein